MKNLEFSVLNEVANSPFAYLIMFMALLGYVIKSSDAREVKMREQLDKIVPILDHLVREIESIKKSISRKRDKDE